MAFDGIVTKAIASELKELSGARIDKVFQPNKNNILLGFYLDGSNYLLNICLDSKNYRIHLTTHAKPNPKIAPNFCMVLRKHLLGLHIKNIITNNLERLIIIDFEGFNDVDDIVSKRLAIELMGRHCNVILLDEQNIIIDSLRHINKEESTRTIVPHTKYVYPSTDKFNFLDCLTFEDFHKKLSTDFNISNIFNGISKSFIESSMKHLKINKLDLSNLENLYNYISEIINNTDNGLLDFQEVTSPKKDYFLVKSENTSLFHLNFFVDDFYYKKESVEEFKNFRDSVLKMILEILKKYKKRLLNIDEKLQSCKDMNKYQLYGELITANLYKIKNENLKEITLENYYTNENITIFLDDRYTPNINAKHFFKKYHKLKNTLEIVSKQKEETSRELNYIESIVYELENSSTLEDVQDIFEEMSENVIFKEKLKKKEKKKKNTKKKKQHIFSPIEYEIDGFKVYVGRNNKENDWLTLSFANKNDIWFHAKDIHGSHVILRVENGKCIDDDILVKCAEIAAKHSKAKESSNVPVDYCLVQFVKKPNGAKPGMVIFTNNKTINVKPQNSYLLKYESFFIL